MPKSIVQREHSVLRQIAQEVPVKDITSPKIQKILSEMSEALESQNDGVALAAPQIAYPLKIFIVSWRAFDEDYLEGRKKRFEEKVAKGQPKIDTTDKKKNLIFINPKISRISKQKEWLPEGCLSVRPIYGLTHRSKKATVTAYDENGKKFTMHGSGLLAQIFQHETDHLKGVLFIDHAKDLREEQLP